MDKLLKNSIIIAIAVVAFSVFYYFVIFLPAEQKAFREQQLKIEAEKQVQYEVAETRKREQQRTARYALLACFDRAVETYSMDWKSNCKSRGLPDNCTLPLNLADSLGKDRDRRKDDCFRLYPVNK
jgi:hypothetical protein